MFWTRLPFVILLVMATAQVWAQAPAEFEPYAAFWLGQEAKVAAVGDLNGDGRDDAAVAAWPAMLYVFYQQPDGTLGAPAQLAAPNMSLGLAIGDLNGDGLGDLAVGGSGGLIFLYYQQADHALGLPVTCYAYGLTNGIAITDLDGDGLADLAVSTGSASVVLVMLQNPGGGFGLPIAYRVTGRNPRSIQTLDFNSDGLRDIALLLDDQIAFLAGSPAGGFDAPSYLSATWAHSLAAGDITGDGLDDLAFTVASNQPYSQIGVYAQTDPPAPPALAAFPAYDYAEALALADTDGDGRKDVVAAHAGYEALTITHQTESGSLGPWVVYPIPYCNYYYPGALAVGDLDSDRLPDIALADPYNGLVVLLHTRSADTLAPTCTAQVAGTPGLAGWYVSPVLVTLTAQDEPGGSGLKTVAYTSDGTSWLTYAGPITVSAEGITQLGYFAEDAAGNRSDTQWIELKVDTQAPVLSLTPSVTELWPPTGKLVEVAVNASGVDSASGLTNLHLEVVDEYGIVEPEMDITANPAIVPLVASRAEGDLNGRVYTLVLTGTDAAGNRAAVQATVTVPHKSPEKPKKPKK